MAGVCSRVDLTIMSQSGMTRSGTDGIMKSKFSLLFVLLLVVGLEWGILAWILPRSRGVVDEREIDIAGDLFDIRVGTVYSMCPIM